MHKVVSVGEAIAGHVRDGMTVAMGTGLESCMPFAAGREIIRQGRRDLTLVGPISDILFDQLIGAGCVSRVIAAWAGNVGDGTAYNFRRAVEVEIVEDDAIRSDPNRTCVPGFLVGAGDHRGYLDRVGAERVRALRPREAVLAAPVDYGR
jgi:acyl CoA:acetate/3-ketoacid CoA transferase alpha subunit